MNLICYLSNGYPSIEKSMEMAHHYVNAGCDMIEIDFPAYNPYLESDYIANRMKVALEKCSDYSKYMNAMIDLKNQLPNTKFIMLSYEETILSIGCDKFIEFCKENNFMDLILVGQKDDIVQKKLIDNGIRVSCYVQFSMIDEEVNAAINSNGFVYMQGKTSSDKINPKFPTLKDCILHLRKQGIDRPIYCGVGIHTPDDAQMAKDSGADGIFVGSAILKLHENIPEMSKTISSFKEKC